MAHKAAHITLDELSSVLKDPWTKKSIGKLTHTDRKEIASVIYAKEIVQDAYKKIGRIIQAAMLEKRAEGYCSTGFLYCLNFVGFEPHKTMCAECKRKKANPKYHRQVSQYGKIREMERKMSKKEK